MIITPLVLLLAVQTPADSSSAYLDPTARRLVAAARARRETVDRSISAYRVTMRERIGAGVRALRRDRMLFRRELVLKIDWRRDSIGRIDVIGARQAVPAVTAQVELPEDLRGDAPDYAFDPADDRLTIGFGRSEESEEEDSSSRRRNVVLGHPLAPGSEANYRFATGDSSVIVFPDGRTIVLRELRVMPRRVAFELMTGSLWIDEKTHGVVRALFRPARPFDLEEDGDEDDVEDVPGFVKPIRVEIRFISIDYGLWDGRWWLPRLMAFEGVGTAGSWLQMPMRYERLYEDYEVTGDTASRRAPRPPRATAAADSTARARCRADGDSLGLRCVCRNGECLRFAVNIPTDTAALLGSAQLPPPFAGMGDTMFSASEARELTQGLSRLPQAPWQVHLRPPRWGLARYNRVEGLALGAKGELDLGRLQLDGTARIALADGEPDVEAGVRREARTMRLRVSAYRRLNGMEPDANSLGFGNSLSALILGRDDGNYFRSAGVSLTIDPAVTASQSFGVRVYAERQRGAVKQTDFSFPHLLHGDHVFRPNVGADSADQIGAAVTLRAQRGFDPQAARWSTEMSLDGGAGTFGFGRASATLRVTAPVTSKAAAAVELAAGTSAGRVPMQSRWYLGGPNTLRGYGGGAMSGDAFWRARVEVANSYPAARVALFCDVGRAAGREQLSLARPLIGAGIGASFLDGLMRIDLARALRSPKGWRLDFYMDGVL